MRRTPHLHGFLIAIATLLLPLTAGAQPLGALELVVEDSDIEDDAGRSRFGLRQAPQVILEPDEAWLMQLEVTVSLEHLRRYAIGCQPDADQRAESVEVGWLIADDGSARGGYVASDPSQTRFDDCLLVAVQTTAFPAPGYWTELALSWAIERDESERIGGAVRRAAAIGVPITEAERFVGATPSISSLRDDFPMIIEMVDIAVDPAEGPEGSALPDLAGAAGVLIWPRRSDDASGNPRVVGIVWDAAGQANAFFGVILPP